MTLTQSDKLWLRKMVREEFTTIIEEAAATSLGGYEGATPVVEDEHAERGHARIGFHADRTVMKTQK